jgi:hypothetical protein
VGGADGETVGVVHDRVERALGGAGVLSDDGDGPAQAHERSHAALRGVGELSFVVGVGVLVLDGEDGGGGLDLHPVLASFDSDSHADRGAAGGLRNGGAAHAEVQQLQDVLPNRVDVGPGAGLRFVPLWFGGLSRAQLFVGLLHGGHSIFTFLVSLTT